MSKVNLLRLSITLLIVVGIGAATFYGPNFFIAKEQPAPRLRTGGTSVAAILLENVWRPPYLINKGIRVDYESTGSSAGVERVIDGQYAVGFTHAALTEDQKQAARAKGGDVLHIPVIVCAVIPIYNLKELKDKPPLKFTGEVLADIYRGKIERWNDPALKKLNEGVELPDSKIIVVHREDSSGTTFLFTDYLQDASEAWRKEVGPPNNKIKWPVGEGRERNQGVANYVARTEGTIGYVDRVFAGEGGDEVLQFGAVQNKDKTAFIHAETANMTAALAGHLAEVSDDLTVRLINLSGPDAYPICGCIWAVCYQAQPASNLKMLVDFLQWVTHDGQKIATNKTFAPLPEEMVRRVDEKLKLIRLAP